MHDNLLIMVKKQKLRWYCHISRFAGIAKTIERSQQERKTEEEMGRQRHRMDNNGVWRFLDGSGRQGLVERYCCNAIRGATATVQVMGLRSLITQRDSGMGG